VTALQAELNAVAAMTYRVLDTVEILDAAVSSGDSLIARYAAATLSDLADQIETALLAADCGGRALRAVIVT